MSRVLLSRSLVARKAEVPGIVSAVADAAAAVLPAADLHRVELAVEEAVVNICDYAYEGAEGKLAVRVLEDDGRLLVEFADQGPAFDPLQQPPPELSTDLEHRPVGGLGIHLMRQVTEKLHYERKGDRNILTLVFRTAA
jgi:serine/threonine-protein kinase RsbW